VDVTYAMSPLLFLCICEGFRISTQAPGVTEIQAATDKSGPEVASTPKAEVDTEVTINIGYVWCIAITRNFRIARGNIVN